MCVRSKRSCKGIKRARLFRLIALDIQLFSSVRRPAEQASGADCFVGLLLEQRFTFLLLKLCFPGVANQGSASKDWTQIRLRPNKYPNCIWWHGFFTQVAHFVK